MKATLIVAERHPHIEKIAVTGFCTGVGRMSPAVCAEQMYQAFREIILGERLNFQDWGGAQRQQRRLNPEGMIFG